VAGGQRGRFEEKVLGSCIESGAVVTSVTSWAGRCEEPYPSKRHATHGVSKSKISSTHNKMTTP